jgi:hypothetical protein
VKCVSALNALAGNGAGVGEGSAGEDQTLLLGTDALALVNAVLDLENGVLGLNVHLNLFGRESLNLEKEI